MFSSKVLVFTVGVHIEVALVWDRLPSFCTFFVNPSWSWCLLLGEVVHSISFFKTVSFSVGNYYSWCDNKVWLLLDDGTGDEALRVVSSVTWLKTGSFPEGSSSVTEQMGGAEDETSRHISSTLVSFHTLRGEDVIAGLDLWRGWVCAMTYGQFCHPRPPPPVSCQDFYS